MTTAVGAPAPAYAAATDRLRFVVAFAAAVMAVLGAAGVIAPLLFSDPDLIKYAATVLGPLLVVTACVSDDPLKIFVGASIVAAPFASLVATFAGQEISLITPLLIASVGLAVATGRRESRVSPVGAAAAVAGVLLVVPLADGDWEPYLTVIIVGASLAYVVSRVVAGSRNGLLFVMGAIVAAGALQGAIAIWEFQTGNQFNPYRETASAVFGRNYFFGFEDLNRPSAALFDPISLGNVLALSLPVAVTLAVRLRDPRGRFLVAAAAALIALGLTLTFSRMSWIGAVVGVVVAVALLPRGARARAIAGGTTVAFAVVAIAVVTAGPELGKRFDSILNPTAKSTATSDGDRTRLALWEGAARTAEASPVAGVGIGEIGPALARQGAPSGEGTHAHSTYLQLLAEGGLLGGAALLLIAVTTIGGVAEGLRRDRILIAGLGGAVAAVLTVWITDYTVRYTAVAAAMAVLVGVAAAQRPSATGARQLARWRPGRRPGVTEAR